MTVFLKRFWLTLFYKNIKPFQINEEEQFYKYIDSNVVDITTFESNWPYILQATRGRGLKYEKLDSILYFWLRNSKEIIVVNRLGKESCLLLSELREIAVRMGMVIIIKNVLEEEASGLEKIGFTKRKAVWSEYSYSDDNTFPQIVSDFQAIVDLKSSGMKESNRRYVRKFIREKNIKVLPYDRKYERETRALLKENSQYLEDKKVESAEEVYAAHLFFFNEDIKHKIRLAYIEDNSLIAVGFFTVRKGVAYWNALINKNKPNLMLFLLWNGLKYIKDNVDEDVKYISLQGSETQGQFDWKSSFYPVKVLEKVHMESMTDLRLEPKL